jgi:hypothetical protein
MKRAITILDACSDPALYGRWFKNRASWSAWFAFLAALFGLPLTPEQLAVYRQCTGRSLPMSNGFNEAWLSAAGAAASRSSLL